MDITKKDRIILINQYRILAALNHDEADHYNELIIILEKGFEVFYSMIDEWISDDMPSDEGKFVLDILDLYRSIEQLKRKSKSYEFLTHSHAIFRGFDGNHETSYMGFARFLIEQQGKFVEQEEYLSKNDNMNSHMPMIGKYRSMLSIWNELEKPWELNEEQALRILNA